MKKILLGVSVLLLTLVAISCEKDPEVRKYKSKHVVLVVVDGARYSETWGFPGRIFIPYRSSLSAQGIICESVYNSGKTLTNPGHTALCTGVFQTIDNTGLQYPDHPSLFQYFRKAFDLPPTDTYICTTKDKLEILSNTTDPVWKNQYRPSTDCGINGLGTGYREDSTTLKNAKSILTSYHPKLMLIQFKQPDAAGHTGDSLAYLQGIRDTDYYIFQLWNLLQNDPEYAGTTTLLVTNDHGRHTAGHLDGFISHGDDCDGCKHIELFGLGPDFKTGYVNTDTWQQVDIAATMAELLGFSAPSCKGMVIRPILQDQP